jgi:hypothetical protein
VQGVIIIGGVFPGWLRQRSRSQRSTTSTSRPARSTACNARLQVSRADGHRDLVAVHACSSLWATRALDLRTQGERTR